MNYTFKITEFGLIIHESLIENKTFQASLKSLVIVMVVVVELMGKGGEYLIMIFFHLPIIIGSNHFYLPISYRERSEYVVKGRTI